MGRERPPNKDAPSNRAARHRSVTACLSRADCGQSGAVVPIPELCCDPTTDLQSGLDRIRQEVGIPETFPPEVLAEAAAAARRVAVMPEPRDLRELPFVTIDPPGSRDLDQAVLITAT